MLGLYAIEFFELASPDRPAGLAGGGVSGNALLTRLKPLSSFRVELPISLDWRRETTDSRLPRALRRILRREPRIGRRCGIAAELAIGERRLAVCSLHLEDKAGGVSGRWSQYLAAVAALEARCPAPAASVIAGDLNTFDSRLARLYSRDHDGTALGRPAGTPEAAWWKTHLLPTTGYTDPIPPTAWTFRVRPFFRAKLDWITTRGGAVRDLGVGPFSSSDHRPLWIDLDLDGAPASPAPNSEHSQP
jgi:endonuclease/exonuclease/phosphatase family metal-dependent hydrolase